MQVNIDRAIKAYCPDFSPIRRILRELGAKQVELKEQLDFIYNLPGTEEEVRTRRLRLRIENNHKQFLYYYDRRGGDVGAATFQIWEICDPNIQKILDTALGVRTTVKKQREVWQKGNLIFNLDTVEGIGQIFELEALLDQNCKSSDQVAEFHRRLHPHLGLYIDGSNEDLVSPTS